MPDNEQIAANYETIDCVKISGIKHVLTLGSVGGLPPGKSTQTWLLGSPIGRSLGVLRWRPAAILRPKSTRGPTAKLSNNASLPSPPYNSRHSGGDVTETDLRRRGFFSVCPMSPPHDLSSTEVVLGFGIFGNMAADERHGTRHIGP